MQVPATAAPSVGGSGDLQELKHKLLDASCALHFGQASGEKRAVLQELALALEAAGPASGAQAVGSPPLAATGKHTTLLTRALCHRPVLVAGLEALRW